MAVYNLGTARGAIEIDTNDLKNADIALRGAGTSMVGFGAAALGAFGYVIGVGAQFEKEMSFVSAVTGASVGELEALEAAAIELGKKGPYGPREVAAGFVDLAKAGLSAEEIIGGVGEAAVNLAAAGDIPFTESAETLVNVMRTFNIEAGEVASTVDAIAGAANASTIDISDMAVSLKYAGAPAAALGLTVEELNAAIGILGNRGIRGSTAGTSLRRVFLQLASPTQAAKDRMRELGLITEDGANAFFTAEGKAKDLAEIFQILQDATAGLTSQEQIAALNDIFGARAVNSALILMEQGADGFAEFTDQMLGVSAADVAAERMDNLSGAVTRLKAALEATFIQAGSPFQEFLTDLVNILREVVLWFGNLPKGVQTFILGSIAAIGVLSLLSGAFLLTVGNIVRAVRVFGELGHAFKIIGPAIKGVAAGMKALSLAFLANPVVLIIAAIIALGVAFYMLYTRSEGFRNFIDKTWQTIQKVWDDVLNFVKKIPEFFTKAWDTVKKKTDEVWDAVYEKVSGVIGGIIGFFTELPGQVAGFVSSIGSAVSSVVGSAFASLVGFFLDLPGIIGRALTGAVKAIVGFLAKLPFYFGYAIGFILGGFVRLNVEVLKIMGKLLTGIINVLIALPGQILNILGIVLSNVISWGGQLIGFMIDLFTNVVTGAVNLLLQLPGMLWNILTTVLSNFFNFGTQLLTFVGQLFANVLTTAVSFLMQLPGAVWNFLSSAVGTLIGFIPTFGGAALDIGSAIIRGIVDTVTGLPGLVWDILTDVIGAFTDLVQTAFNAAKDFAGGLWEGFKKGLGINSPSFIEEAMFAIQRETEGTAQRLRSTVRTIQGLTSGIPIDLLASSTGATVTGAGAAGVAGGMVIQGPLLVVETLTGTEEEALSISRRLANLTYEQFQANGKRGAQVVGSY